MNTEIDSVVVMVCTRNRLSMLADCLKSVEGQLLPYGVDVAIVVADNSVEGHEAEIYAMCSRAHYIHEPRRGYSNIRNAAKRRALEFSSAQLMVFVDDDVIAAPDMVHRHIQSMQKFSADVSAGASGPVKYVDGDPIFRVGTANVAFRRWIAERCTFCDEANLLGSEDVEFFYDARALGAKLIRTPSAMISGNSKSVEEYPHHYGDLIAYASARNDIHLFRMRRGMVRATVRYVRSYLPRVVNGGLALAAAKLTGSTHYTCAAVRYFARHKGALEGLRSGGVDRAMAKVGKIVPVPIKSNEFIRRQV